MAELDARLSEYFVKYIVPFALFLVVLKLLGNVLNKLQLYIFSLICSGLSKKHHKIIKEQKDKLFSNIAEARKDSDKGTFRALEVGCGSGANFEKYPPNTALTVVEPNGHFRKQVFENAAQHPSLEVKEFLEMGAEDLKGHVEDSSQDAVVSTLTMCSVNDIDAVVSEVYRVLKPGGRFYFIEHTRAHNLKSWTHLIQRMLAPLFFVLAHCNLTNTFWVSVDRMGFKKVQYTKMEVKKVPIIVRSHVFGYAAK